MSNILPSARVAYLGPEGTYSHAALEKYFGSQQPCLAVDDIPSVFNAVDSDQADFGLVPVENSSEGSVTQTLDCFGASDAIICGEVMLRIQHCLLAQPGTLAENIKRVVSHQQSLGQCRYWLEENYPGVEKVSALSNAEAAIQASRMQDTAAIAGKTAAEIYGLSILNENIEDVHDNTTRFAIISKNNAQAPSRRDKSSLIISTRNEPGALFNALEPFKNHAVNLIKLESRPSRKEAWSYSFFVDIEGHHEDANIRAAFEELSGHSLEFRVLGSYPVASPN